MLFASFVVASISPSAASSIENAEDSGAGFFDAPAAPGLPIEKPPLKFKVTGLSETGRADASTGA